MLRAPAYSLTGLYSVDSRPRGAVGWPTRSTRPPTGASPRVSLNEKRETAIASYERDNLDCDVLAVVLEGVVPKQFADDIRLTRAVCGFALHRHPAAGSRPADEVVVAARVVEDAFLSDGV